jgi:hypothetical protein
MRAWGRRPPRTTLGELLGFSKVGVKDVRVVLDFTRLDKARVELLGVIALHAAIRVQQVATTRMGGPQNSKTSASKIRVRGHFPVPVSLKRECRRIWSRRFVEAQHFSTVGDRPT